jgi:hypothetical protein
VRSVAKRGSRSNEPLTGYALPCQRVEQIEVNRQIAALYGDHTADYDVVITDILPVGHYDGRRLSGGCRHLPTRQRPKPTTAFEVVLYDLRDIQSAVGRNGAREWHHGDWHWVSDAGSNLHVQLGPHGQHGPEGKDDTCDV